MIYQTRIKRYQDQIFNLAVMPTGLGFPIGWLLAIMFEMEGINVTSVLWASAGLAVIIATYVASCRGIALLEEGIALAKEAIAIEQEQELSRKKILALEQSIAEQKAYLEAMEHMTHEEIITSYAARHGMTIAEVIARFSPKSL